MIKRVLIANRGEIARRVARTCRRLGTEYACIYSDADRHSLHLEGAAASVHIGPSAPAASYLNIERIVAAAVEAECDSVHPGYGFLSENATFARRVESAGLVFIGPAPETIEMLGDKARAKDAMRAAGVPTVPGSASASAEVRQIVAWAAEIGLPVLLKPSAGGGGKGMQVVRAMQDLVPAAEQAIRLAAANFKDGRILVERFVENPRHIEVQIFGDGNGNAVHLFERECSLQRRHQKVIEEAPAIRLRPDVRRMLLSAAVRGAQAIRYRNAGTFEFIANDDGEFFFLEVNTRLQVEHPVSEEVTGLDFVEWQLQVASTGRLPLAQDDIHCSGNAIEARIYAEDPADSFKPAPGRALQVRWPEQVRVESAIASGSEVPPYYDPMVAKVVAKGTDRATAIDALASALRDTVILGLTTNIGFLSRLLSNPDVRAGNIHTGYIDQQAELLTARRAESEVAEAAAGVRALQLYSVARASWDLPVGPVDRGSLGVSAPTDAGAIVLWRGSNRHIVHLGHLTASTALAGETLVALVARQDGFLSVDAGGRRVSLCANSGPLELMDSGERWTFTDLSSRRAAATKAGNAAEAPMHGVVVAIAVAVGEKVRAGQTMVVVEAMKMENAVVAPFDGVVSAVLCELREQVAAGQVLVRLESPDS